MSRKPIERDDLMARTRAAVAYVGRTGNSAERQAELEMAAFMSLFHPEVSDDTVRDLVQDARAKAKRITR